jgi:hypothetical protein
MVRIPVMGWQCPLSAPGMTAVGKIGRSGGSLERSASDPGCVKTFFRGAWRKIDSRQVLISQR